MDRKKCLMKIDDVTRRQVMFSKRKSKLMKKAWELSICCDVDVACIAFSPSAGRITKFSSPKRIDELIRRYVNLPPESRYNEMDNVQEIVEKLRQLDHIHGDKVHYLDKQVENLELQIEKSMLLLNILESDMRVFEPRQDEEPNLDQLIRNEIYLKRSLEKVIQRKNMISIDNPSGKFYPQIAGEGVRPLFNVFESDQNSAGKFSLKPDHWTVPHSAKVPKDFLQSLTNKEKGKFVQDQGIATSACYGTRKISGENPQLVFIGQETRFVPTMENAFRSVAQRDPQIPSLNVFGDSTLSHSLQDIHPLSVERTTSLPLHKNPFTSFALNNGQISMGYTQALTDDIDFAHQTDGHGASGGGE